MAVPANITAAERIMARKLASLISGGGGDDEIAFSDAQVFTESLAETVDMDDLSSTSAGEGAALIGQSEGGFAGTTVQAVLSEIVSTTAGEGAAVVGYSDAGAYTAANEVESALDEIYQHIVTTQASVHIPMGANWFEIDGTALAAFVDGVSTTPGLALDGSEAAGIRWNNDAAPDAICTSVLLPYDLDGTAAVTLNILAHKSGATLGDAVTWAVTAFIQQDGALYDADADLGGTSSAMTGDAAAKTSQLETLALAAGDIPDTNPAMLTLTIKPTAGTLGTDDVTITGMWLTYTRKILTS